MLSLEIFEKNAKIFFSRLVSFCILMYMDEGDRTILDFMVSCFSVGTSLSGYAMVLMHATMITCPQVGAKCYPHFVG
jgi:hypothetical protein